MSVYFEFPCDIDAERGVAVAALSNDEHTLLAIGNRYGEVRVYNEEGQNIQNANSLTAHSPTLNALITRSAEATALCFHPTLSLLIVGWSDGALSLWSDGGGPLREERAHRNNAVTALRWSDDGSRLVSGDSGGGMAMWNIDARGRLNAVTALSRKGQIDHISFRGTGNVFFGGAIGSVYYADEKGKCSEVILTTSPIISLHFAKASERIVLITADLSLYQFAFNNADHTRMQQTHKVKLSIKGQIKTQHIAHIGAHTIAVANGNSIRLFDLTSDDHYQLSTQKSRRRTTNMKSLRLLRSTRIVYCLLQVHRAVASFNGI